jgi:hypothetical protein
VKPTGPGQSTQLLLEVVSLLDEAGVNYVVIGALAAAVHGVVRASVDADAVVQVTVAKLSELQATLASRGLTTELRRGDVEDPIPAMLQITDGFSNQVDLLDLVDARRAMAVSRKAARRARQIQLQVKSSAPTGWQNSGQPRARQ